MKCEKCDRHATQHVTEIRDGEPVEFHVCDEHVGTVNSLVGQSAITVKNSFVGQTYTKMNWSEAWEVLHDFRGSWSDATARETLARQLVPWLCQSLLDENPNVRALAASWLWLFGSHASSALPALRAALDDANPRVHRAVRAAIDLIEKSESMLFGD